jgi:hypothetical protein
MDGNKTIPASRWPAWLNAAALLIVSWVAIAALAFQARPGAEIVAVAFPPWWNAQQVLLRTAGAWIAIDPQAIAACFKI